MENEVKSNTSKNANFDFMSVVMDCLAFILAVVLKPIKSLKTKINDYSDVKKAGILVGVVALGRMLIGLIGNMISVIFVKQVNYFSGDSKLVVSFENLKDLKYFDLIVKQFIGYVIVVAAVAGVYYIVSLIMKKTVNYFKIVSITSVAFVPTFVAGFASILVSYIYEPLALFIVLAGFIYSFLIFIHGVDNELSFDNSDMKIYFHSICLTVLFVISYYVLSNYISSVLGIGSLL